MRRKYGGKFSVPLYIKYLRQDERGQQKTPEWLPGLFISHLAPE
jgi:hypothetical protein